MDVTALVIAGLAAAAAIVSAIYAILSRLDAARSATAADRSAAAAEAAERRAREPHLAILLTVPSPDPVDRVIYRIRNDGPQDLDSVVIFRPEPGDGVVYRLAVTGSAAGFQNEIELGPLALNRESSFTLSCGAGTDLPEFRVRIRCTAGQEHWDLIEVLPPPRGEPLSPEEYASRDDTLARALAEVDRNTETLRGENWHSIPLATDRISEAYELVQLRAPERSGPIRDLVTGVDDFKVWLNRSGGSFPGDQMTQEKEALFGLFGSAAQELRNLRDALYSGRTSSPPWRN